MVRAVLRQKRCLLVRSIMHGIAEHDYFKCAILYKSALLITLFFSPPFTVWADSRIQRQDDLRWLLGRS